MGTFRPFDFSDVQPTKVEEVKAQGWTLINAECNADPAKSSFAGYRWLQPYVTVEGKKQSNFVQLYDADGHVAGTQSIVPVEKFMWDCTYNDYYVKENITLDDGYVREFCVSTMYFRDPSTLCTKMEDDEVENALFIQKKRQLCSRQFGAHAKNIPPSRTKPRLLGHRQVHSQNGSPHHSQLARLGGLQKLLAPSGSLRSRRRTLPQLWICLESLGSRCQ